MLEGQYRFDIILFQQTPKVEPMTPGDCVKWIESNQKLISDFRNYAQSNEKIAKGYAANQLIDLTVNERLMARMFAKKNEKGIFEVYINPRITGFESESYWAEEYCLTWPGKAINVEERYKVIQVKYWTPKGHERMTELSGVQAQIWQHEQDHLDGVEEDVREKDWKTFKRTGTKIGRNELCPCGSNKKYKKCCGR